MKFGPGTVLVTYADGTTKSFDVQQFTIDPQGPAPTHFVVHRDDLAALGPDWRRLSDPYSAAGPVTEEEICAALRDKPEIHARLLSEHQFYDQPRKAAQWKRELTRRGSGRR